MNTEKFLKRKKGVRSKIFGTAKKPRLCVYRSNKYISAQIVNDEKQITLVSFSEKELKKTAEKVKGKVEAAKNVGIKLAEKAVNLKIKKVVFDRSGYRYHGRVKALADGAREGGLSF